jgi:uncharacterized cofD-like protein
MNDNLISKQPSIVVIGGGTGSYTVLSGLKHYVDDITALVNMSDDGGSTGLLRDELGVLPAGDIRQCLVALSDTEKVRDLFTYRFSDGSFKGHSFGNIFISTVEKMTDSFEKAVDLASEILNIKGRVMPITLDKVTLKATTEDGISIEGESKIGNSKLGVLKPKLSYDKPANIYKPAEEAIMGADVVVIAPGNLNGSIGPALIVDGVGEALKETSAKVVVISNLVNKPGQTDNFTVTDYISEIERFAGADIVDYVIYNTDEPTKQMKAKYVKDGEYMLEFDLEKLEEQKYIAVGLPLIDKTPIKLDENDSISKVRSLIRHNKDALAREIMKIYFS